MAFDTGSRLGPYEITGIVGVGGRGEVYRTRHIKLGRLIALKTLPAELAWDLNRLARFEREVRLLATRSPANFWLNQHPGSPTVAAFALPSER